MNKNNFFYNILLLKNIHTSIAKNYNEKTVDLFKKIFLLVMNLFLVLTVKDKSFDYTLPEKFLFILFWFLIIFFVSEKLITYKNLSYIFIVPKHHNYNKQDFLTKELFSEMTYTVLTINKIYNDKISELESTLINQYIDEILVNIESCIVSDSSKSYIGKIETKAVIDLLNMIQEIVKKLNNNIDIKADRVDRIKTLIVNI